MGRSSGGGGRSGGGGGAAVATPAGGVALPDGVAVSRSGEDVLYTFQQGADRVVVEINYLAALNEYDIIFRVNDKLSAESGRDASQGAAIARKIGAVAKYDASRRPDGFVYSANASTSDGLGATRAALYARAGFSLPRTVAGGDQYAVVQGGKLVPSNAKGKALSAAQIAQQRTAAREALRDAARSELRQSRRAESRARNRG